MEEKQGTEIQAEVMEEQGELFQPVENVAREVLLTKRFCELAKEPNTYDVIQERRRIVKELYEIKFGKVDKDE